MKMPWKMSWHYVVIALLIGVIVGMGVNRFEAQEFYPRTKHSGKMKERMIERLSSKLDLSAEQKTKVMAIFEAQKPKMMALEKEMHPKFEALRTETDQEIKKVLTPEQQKKFDQVKAKMEARWKNRHGGFSSHGPAQGQWKEQQDDFPPPPPSQPEE